ncbi:hypothetical protein ACEPAF_4383 [Sanghuangporus sanghuang]
MLKNASLIAHGQHYALCARPVSEAHPELGHGFLSSGSHFRARFVQQKRSAYFTRGGDVGRPFARGASSTVATQQRASTSILLHTRASPVRGTHSALHTEARAQVQSQSRSRSQPHSLNEGGKDENNDTDTTEALSSKLKVRHAERPDLSILKEETYEYMLDDLRMAMKHTDPNQTRSRSIAWTDGWTGEKPREKQARDSGKLGRERGKRRTIEGSGRDEGVKRPAGTQRKAFDDSQPSSRPQNKIPSFDDSSNPLLERILPIYYRNSHLRQARMRRNDLRNLSYLEAEAKLGMASELYFNGSFASGKARGGRRKETEIWRGKKVIEHFERETSEKPTWTREQGKGEESRDPRKNRGTGEKDSFTKVWGNLASTMRS